MGDNLRDLKEFKESADRILEKSSLANERDKEEETKALIQSIEQLKQYADSMNGNQKGEDLKIIANQLIQDVKSYCNDSSNKDKIRENFEKHIIEVKNCAKLIRINISTIIKNILFCATGIGLIINTINLAATGRWLFSKEKTTSTEYVNTIESKANKIFKKNKL